MKTKSAINGMQKRDKNCYINNISLMKTVTIVNQTEKKENILYSTIARP